MMLEPGRIIYFNPRSPHRERRHSGAAPGRSRQFQSTLPSQGATVFPAVLMVGLYNFNPRSPHRERPENISSIYESLLFQSTLPSQGATVRYIGNGLGVEHFNPRSPHRERLSRFGLVNLMSVISIHAPLTGSDDGSNTSQTDKTIFQSTLPSQGATRDRLRKPPSLSISIHAPLTGSDGGALELQSMLTLFQSTLPSQGATLPLDEYIDIAKISIHAPLTGSDKTQRSKQNRSYLFQSTLPSQGATKYTIVSGDTLWNFNPRSPHRERLATVTLFSFAIFISIHAPLTGSDPFELYCHP